MLTLDQSFAASMNAVIFHYGIFDYSFRLIQVSNNFCASLFFFSPGPGAEYMGSDLYVSSHILQPVIRVTNAPR